MVELLSGYPILPDSAPLSSHRYDSEVRVLGYTEALGSLPQVVEKAGDDPRRSRPSFVAYRCRDCAGDRGGVAAKGDLERVDGSHHNLPRFRPEIIRRTLV